MGSAIQEYIIQQEHAGFNEEAIKQALAANRYSQEQIKQAFADLQGGIADAALHEYVQQYTRQNMTPVQIFKTLVEQGYSAKSVRRAIQAVFGQGTLPVHHATIFLGVAVFVALSVLYFLSALSNPDVNQPTQNGNPITFSASDQIAQIITIARTKGKDAAIQECDLRLRNDDRDLCVLDIAVLDTVQDSTLCNRISDAQLKDTCLMNFLEQDTDGICKQVTLKSNIQICEQIASLRIESV